jgi:hypothetical protein
VKIKIPKISKIKEEKFIFPYSIEDFSTQSLGQIALGSLVKQWLIEGCIVEEVAP